MLKLKIQVKLRFPQWFVVLVDFETDEGRSLILELQRTDKGFIPLGADVLNEKNESIGTVARRGKPMSAALKMKVRFMLSGEAIKTVNVTCIITSQQMLKK